MEIPSDAPCRARRHRPARHVPRSPRGDPCPPARTAGAGATNRLGETRSSLRQNLRRLGRPTGPSHPVDGRAAHPQAREEPLRRGGLRRLRRDPLLPCLSRGKRFFQHNLPLDRSSMTLWRKRIGAERLETLLADASAIRCDSGAVSRSDRARVRSSLGSIGSMPSGRPAATMAPNSGTGCGVGGFRARCALSTNGPPGDGATRRLEARADVRAHALSPDCFRPARTR